MKFSEAPWAKKAPRAQSAVKWELGGWMRLGRPNSQKYEI
jgi:hypothetical protein